MIARVLLILLLALPSAMVNALPITVSGTGTTADGDWEISVQTGTFNDLSAILALQPWWNDTDPGSALALVGAFLHETKLALGTPNTNSIGWALGPLFALSTQTGAANTVAASSWALRPGGLESQLTGSYFNDVSYTFATASRAGVPEPSATALLSLSLAVFLFSSRRRRSRQ